MSQSLAKSPINTLEYVTRPEKLLACIQQISCRGYSNPVKTVLLLWFIGLKPSVATLSEIVMEATSRVILSLTLLYHSLVRADYVDRSEGNGDVKIDATLIALIVFGVIIVIQLLVFVIFSCRAYDALYASHSRILESSTGIQFPFLPSYDTALQDARVAPEGNTPSTSNTGIDSGVIWINRGLRTCPARIQTEMTPPLDPSTNHSGVNTRGSDGVVMDIESLTANQVMERQRDV